MKLTTLYRPWLTVVDPYKAIALPMKLKEADAPDAVVLWNGAGDADEGIPEIVFEGVQSSE